MLERRRARSTSLRMSPDEGERESWLCMPAFKAAVAASEWGERALDGDWLRGEGEAWGGEMVLTSGMAAGVIEDYVGVDVGVGVGVNTCR
jgi:hypothetical protein